MRPVGTAKRTDSACFMIFIQDFNHRPWLNLRVISVHQIGDPWGGGPGCVTISGPSNAEARAWYRDNQIPVLAYSSLGRGMFAGLKL